MIGRQLSSFSRPRQRIQRPTYRREIRACKRISAFKHVSSVAASTCGDDGSGETGRQCSYEYRCGDRRVGRGRGQSRGRLSNGARSACGEEDGVRKHLVGDCRWTDRMFKLSVTVSRFWRQVSTIEYRSQGTLVAIVKAHRRLPWSTFCIRSCVRG